MVRFHFFPSSCETGAAASWAAIEAMMNQLETLFRGTAYRPAHRAPKEEYSDGCIGAYLPKGGRLQSGQLFFIAHLSEIFFEGQPGASFD